MHPTHGTVAEQTHGAKRKYSAFRTFFKRLDFGVFMQLLLVIKSPMSTRRACKAYYPATRWKCESRKRPPCDLNTPWSARYQTCVQLPTTKEEEQLPPLPDTNGRRVDLREVYDEDNPKIIFVHETK